MEIHIGDRIANVELISKDDNMVKISIDDIIYDVDIVMAENGVCSIIYKGKSYNAEFTRSDDGRKYSVNTDFITFPVEIIDPQTKYQRSRKKDDTDESQNHISSKMPGKVIKILVSEGEEVKAGHTVVIIEAMKMQNEYKVQKDCIIEKILIEEGDNTVGDQILIILSNPDSSEELKNE